MSTYALDWKESDLPGTHEATIGVFCLHAHTACPGYLMTGAGWSIWAGGGKIKHVTGLPGGTDTRAAAEAALADLCRETLAVLCPVPKDINALGGIKHWLMQHGYDGLVHPGECSCDGSGRDCESPTPDCRPGYLVHAPECEGCPDGPCRSTERDGACPKGIGHD